MSYALKISRLSRSNMKNVSIREIERILSISMRRLKN